MLKGWGFVPRRCLPGWRPQALALGVALQPESREFGRWERGLGWGLARRSRSERGVGVAVGVGPLSESLQKVLLHSAASTQLGCFPCVLVHVTQIYAEVVTFQYKVI